MKITIDTKYKTIEIEEAIIVKDLLSEVSKLLPEYMDYKIIKPYINNYWLYNPHEPYPKKFPYFYSDEVTVGTFTATPEKGTFIS